MFEYSVLDKIRLDCNEYLYPSLPPYITFTYIINLPQKKCLIFITSNLSLIQNKCPSPTFLIILKLLDQLFNLSWYLFYSSLPYAIYDLELV